MVAGPLQLPKSILLCFCLAQALMDALNQGHRVSSTNTAADEHAFEQCLQEWSHLNVSYDPYEQQVSMGPDYHPLGS